MKATDEFFRCFYMQVLCLLWMQDLTMPHLSFVLMVLSGRFGCDAIAQDAATTDRWGGMIWRPLGRLSIALYQLVVCCILRDIVVLCAKICAVLGGW